MFRQRLCREYAKWTWTTYDKAARNHTGILLEERSIRFENICHISVYTVVSDAGRLTSQSICIT